MSTKKPVLWSSCLKSVYNTNNSKHRYYFFICGVWRRVSYVDYVSREIDSNREDCFKTKVVNNLVHQFKTVHGIYYKVVSKSN